MADQINVTNFGPVLGQVLAVVTVLQTDRQLLIQNQDAQTVLLTKVSNTQDIQTTSLEAQSSQIQQLDTDVINLTQLVEALVAAQGTFATQDQFAQVIALLQQIAQTGSTPVNIGLDPTNVFAVPQAIPPARGP